MSYTTIGQAIKKLRKERNFTQEELAEQLNVTAQAVSKWENETGMPDISQIVPLASVFGVSTDVLFGTSGMGDEEDVRQILESACRFNKGYDRYNGLQDGLRKYPNNDWLLMNSLECGIALAYPENDCYDEVRGKEIYQECIRQANILISYGKNAGDILRAHMIMVILHSAYGEIEKAWEHARNFPGRSDMTVHEMSAYIAHAEKNYDKEALSFQWNLIYNFESIFNDLVQLGEAYRSMGKYTDAIKTFHMVFSMTELIFAGERVIPSTHWREWGDVHVLIARTYLELGETGKALDWLEKMVDYDIDIRGRFTNNTRVETPLLRDVIYNFYYYIFEDNKKRLLSKLNGTEFAGLKNNSRFSALLERANGMKG